MADEVLRYASSIIKTCKANSSGWYWGGVLSLAMNLRLVRKGAREGVCWENVYPLSNGQPTPPPEFPGLTRHGPFKGKEDEEYAYTRPDHAELDSIPDSFRSSGATKNVVIWVATIDDVYEIELWREPLTKFVGADWLLSMSQRIDTALGSFQADVQAKIE